MNLRLKNEEESFGNDTLMKIPMPALLFVLPAAILLSTRRVVPHRRRETASVVPQRRRVRPDARGREIRNRCRFRFDSSGHWFSQLDSPKGMVVGVKNELANALGQAAKRSQSITPIVRLREQSEHLAFHATPNLDLDYRRMLRSPARDTQEPPFCGCTSFGNKTSESN